MDMLTKWDVPFSAQRPADRAFIEACNSARAEAALCAELVESPVIGAGPSAKAAKAAAAGDPKILRKSLS
jgi:hypothetical protein